MNTAPKTVPGRLLAPMLGQSEHIQELLRQSAVELAAVNAFIRQTLESSSSLPGVQIALDSNEAVTKSLHEASQSVWAMRQALQVEIRDRTMVDHQLAAAVEQEEASRHAAMHDHLTGLPNRVLFKDRLENAIAHAKRHRWILAVMFVDIDNFKVINDSYGHAAGDFALRTVATRLVHNMRDEDTVSRYGGDEFLCLLTTLRARKDITTIAAKLLDAIRMPCEVPSGKGIVTLNLEASIGVSLFPRHGADAAALITSADHAMYEAKGGKSGFAFPLAEIDALARTAAYGRAGRATILCSNASPRIFDVESSANNLPLPGKNYQKIGA